MTAVGRSPAVALAVVMLVGSTACDKKCVCSRLVGTGSDVSLSTAEFDISEEQCEARDRLYSLGSCEYKTVYSPSAPTEPVER